MPKNMKGCINLSKKTPLVSILVTAYNQSGCIKKAVKSAISQDYKNKETVVCDDSSTDNTSWVLEGLKKQYKNVAIYRNRHNLGRLKNHRRLYRNLANGKYAVMLDGDDYFCDNEFISKAVKSANKDNLKLVFAEAKIVDLSGIIKRVNYPFKKDGVIDCKEIFNKGVLFMHGAVMTEREFGKKTDFYTKDVWSHDQESFLKLIVGEKVGFLKRAVYIYQKDNRPEKYSLKIRIQNDEMVESVYLFAVSKDPKNKNVYSLWRERMLTTLFIGNLINLSYHLKFAFLIQYLSSFIKKYGYKRLLMVLKHARTAYSWGYRVTGSKA